MDDQSARLVEVLRKVMFMAIGFVAAQYMKRRSGHSVLDRLAYIARRRLVSDRTGDIFDYSHRPDLVGEVVTVLPPGALTAFNDAEALWTVVDAAATHKFAALGIDLVIALPAPEEL